MAWTVVFVPKESNMGPKIQDLLPHLADRGGMSATQALVELTLYKLVTNCSHFSRPPENLLQIFGSFV